MPPEFDSVARDDYEIEISLLELGYQEGISDIRKTIAIFGEIKVLSMSITDNFVIRMSIKFGRRTTIVVSSNQ